MVHPRQSPRFLHADCLVSLCHFTLGKHLQCLLLSKQDRPHSRQGVLYSSFALNMATWTTSHVTCVAQHHLLSLLQLLGEGSNSSFAALGKAQDNFTWLAFVPTGGHLVSAPPGFCDSPVDSPDVLAHCLVEVFSRPLHPLQVILYALQLLYSRKVAK